MIFRSYFGNKNLEKLKISTSSPLLSKSQLVARGERTSAPVTAASIAIAPLLLSCLVSPTPTLIFQIKTLFIVCVSFCQSDEIAIAPLAWCLPPSSLTPEYSPNLKNENTKCWRLHFFAIFWWIPPRHGKCVNFSSNHFLPWEILANKRGKTPYRA